MDAHSDGAFLPIEILTHPEGANKEYAETKYDDFKSAANDIGSKEFKVALYLDPKDIEVINAINAFVGW